MAVKEQFARRRRRTPLRVAFALAPKPRSRALVPVIEPCSVRVRAGEEFELDVLPRAGIDGVDLARAGYGERPEVEPNQRKELGRRGLRDVATGRGASGLEALGGIHSTEVAQLARRRAGDGGQLRRGRLVEKERAINEARIKRPGTRRERRRLKQLRERTAVRCHANVGQRHARPCQRAQNLVGSAFALEALPSDEPDGKFLAQREGCPRRAQLPQAAAIAEAKHFAHGIIARATRRLVCPARNLLRRREHRRRRRRRPAKRECIRIITPRITPGDADGIVSVPSYLGSVAASEHPLSFRAHALALLRG
mmetsp:Transcript_8510/g.34574  ORF Transcript_8510/g.34574 Transcript_8510/m.34574 type:complete len:310 (-) Transcript_8510:400-1329(-)